MNTEKFIRKWEKYKHKGKGKYVLTSGIATSIAMFVGSTIGIKYQFEQVAIVLHLY